MKMSLLRQIHSLVYAAMKINTPPCLLCDQIPRREARTFDDNRWILRVPYVLGEFHFLEGG